MKVLSKLTTIAMALLLTLGAAAQSASMLNMARAELQKRGLSEAEVAERLMDKGIDVYSLSPSDYPKYQGEIMATLSEMEAEKKNARSSAENAPVAVSDTVVTSAPVAKVTTDAEVEADKINEAVRAVATKSESDIYGHALFTDNSLDIFRTTDGAEAPETYVLGAGDEIHISIFGASQIDMQQRINSEGYIQPSGAGKIFLKGMTLKQAREAIGNSLSSYYSFGRDQFAVTIITARTVMVNIFGEVNVTGGFTLSALNSAFNAIAAAGGPTEIGSVRAIQVIRGGQKYDLDLYAFMQDPTGKMKLDLQNNDIIYVPTAKNIVTVSGGVQRPMRYEMIDGEDARDLIEFAGGLRADADRSFLQVERYVGGEKKFFEYSLSDVLSGNEKVPLENGDIVRMRSVNQPMENYVTISGSVYYSGTYDLESNRSLMALLEKAKPTYTAKTDYVFVERTRDDKTVEVLTVPFPGINGSPDFRLKERDAVTVLEKSDYRDIATISVNGQVRRPFTKDFALNDKMTVSQAIEYAGGLKESVFPTAYIYRRDLKNPSRMEYISVDLKKDGDKTLQPGDVLNVYDNTTFTNIGEVSVAGAVKNPTRLTFDSKLTIKDLFTMAGGFEEGAALDRIEVFRTNVSNAGTSISKIPMVVDSLYNVVEPAGFQLSPYDKVVVRLIPEFNLGRSVQISGRVRYPGMYVLESKETTLADVVEMAGGLLEDADPFGAQLFRTYRDRGYVTVNLQDAVAHPESQKFNPIMMDGDVINISRRENVVAIYPTGTRMSQYVAEGYGDQAFLQDSLGNYNASNNLPRKVMVYNGKHSAGWYIRKYAGGFVKSADKNSVTVTYANNQMVGTKKVLGIFRVYPKVEPGSSITLTLNPDRVRKETEPKEKVDWNSTLSKALTTLTSAISIAAIISRL